MSTDTPASVKDFINKLPAATQTLVAELRELQAQRTKLEGKLEEEIEALHEKYDKLYQPLYDKRSTLLTKPDGSLPRFWLEVLKKAPVVRDMITEKDEPVLEYLQDIKLTENKKSGFTLSFHFKSNPYFRNNVLTKEFQESEADESAGGAKSLLGDDVRLSSKGTKIDWQVGKDFTTKSVTKKQRHKTTGQPREVTRQTLEQSFFHFFSDVNEEVVDKLTEKDPENMPQVILADVEVGSVIRERVIPFAVSIFTGEMVILGEEEEEDEEDEDEEDDEDEDGDDGEDDDDEDEEEEEEPKKAADAKGGKKAGKKGAGAEKPECKQQ